MLHQFPSFLPLPHLNQVVRGLEMHLPVNHALPGLAQPRALRLDHRLVSHRDAFHDKAVLFLPDKILLLTVGPRGGRRHATVGPHDQIKKQPEIRVKLKMINENRFLLRDMLNFKKYSDCHLTRPKTLQQTQGY
jgi:hypothetical protein